jgi:hypothetical protein
MVHLESKPPHSGPPTPLRHRRPVDLVYLARLTMGDRILECDVLAMFNHQITTYMARISATDAQDEIEFCLGAIKGCALGVGAQNLAELAAGAERELAGGTGGAVEALDDVAMAIEEASAYVSDLLAD